MEEGSGSLFESRIGIGKGYCGKEQDAGGKRHGPNGIADPEVWVIGVQDTKGNWRACLFKYALHSTFHHADNFFVSAEYSGHIRRYLAGCKPGMVFLFAQGTSGNQSPRYFRYGRGKKSVGRVESIGCLAD